ncbi:Aspartyl/glutamyl-tRNA(Asn/Gln) amidotransferase subunit B [Geodia barretti]|uniref:Glutamyl-tRNA(Gln) amidotransferase subunit B, mitochondrial n=1 Tax=Geodia barretti TaxID=519541 RepID=A0AA35WBH2_GEOBA|nr:Aspartyl/glutamyl-tRNA(Asn/Gln) amidotransferase subunit B [Geodia barretti]
MNFEVVIGLEVHAQLSTESKMFCACSSDYQEAEPNTVVCPVCMGMPGVLPVINRRAVEHVIRTGLALGCEISSYTKFDRKNYPYPDLMKGYQISQYDLPIASNGSMPIEVDGVRRSAGITRVHLEEDVAKLMHRTEEFGEGYSLLDVNRAGVPLMEVVGEPDLRSPEEARAYLVQLHSILHVRPVGQVELGTKVEIKNMNSYRSVFRALEYEAERQIEVVRSGRRIVQETRGWDEEESVTFSQRIKEGASDYRYFPEPDLPPLRISPEWVTEVQASIPELPHTRKNRFVHQLGLPEYDAGLLTASQSTADYFEAVLTAAPSGPDLSGQFAKAISNWMLGEMARLLNQSGQHISDVRIEPAQVAELQTMVDDSTLSSTMAKTVFEKMFETGLPPRKIAEFEGLVQISDTDAVQTAVLEAIAANPDPVQDYLAGKQQAMGFLVGQVMKATRGKANPRMASQMVREHLEAMR